jgi:hypothetical protein
MCASIREFGFKIPCLVRSDGELVDGHLRLKAPRSLGLRPESHVFGATRNLSERRMLAQGCRRTKTILGSQQNGVGRAVFGAWTN